MDTHLAGKKVIGWVAENNVHKLMFAGWDTYGCGQPMLSVPEDWDGRDAEMVLRRAGYLGAKRSPFLFKDDDGPRFVQHNPSEWTMKPVFVEA